MLSNGKNTNRLATKQDMDNLILRFDQKIRNHHVQIEDDLMELYERIEKFKQNLKVVEVIEP